MDSAGNSRDSTIYMMPLGHVSGPILAALENRIESTFDSQVVTRVPMFDPHAVAYDSTRNQYNSTQILAALLGEIPPDATKAIAVTNLDLFIPVLTFVFGEAQLGGRVAVASECRLHNRFYGLPEDEDLTSERFEKEAVHELGHVFGLRHCDNPACVMHASPSIEKVDIKHVELCRSCRRQARLPID